jgi:AraC-like DNA-binding protein
MGLGIGGLSFCGWARHYLRGPRSRLNERAMSATELPPLWYLDRGRALFAGPLGRNARHRHSTPVFLAGLYGKFELRVGDGAWRICRTAAIPAGLAYEFDMGGEPLAVLYAEASAAGAHRISRLVRHAEDMAGARVGNDGEVALLREMYEDRDSPSWIPRGLDDLLGFAGRGAGPLDPRVSRVVETLQKSYADLRRVGAVAESVGLSPSRFQHVFTKEVGVPFRRYRAWCRMRAAIGAVLDGSNLTAAAHEAGFSDQAHFARDFRRTFGAPATPSLANVRRAPPRSAIARPRRPCLAG